MKRIALALSTVLLGACANQAQHAVSGAPYQAPSHADVRVVSPSFERYTAEELLGKQWARTELSRRDRSLVTLATLITRQQLIEIPFHTGLALDNGVKPEEIAEIVTHLAFYSGWGNATAAVAAIKPVFDQRGIDLSALAKSDTSRLPLDHVAEDRRATQVARNFGDVAPGVVQNTTDVLFKELWLRPGLSPRDRSLVTVSALVASGQVAQITFHLNRAMDNGLTQKQAAEVLTHLAFYAGWPNVFSALPVFKEVFASRRR